MTEKTISKICSIPDCGKPVRARGWCPLHHQRWLRKGDPLIAGSRGEKKGFNRVENFWRRVDKTSNPNGCWEWQGYRMHLGYGQVTFNCQQYRTHRLAWILTYGKEPDGCLLHSCDNPSCCNPAHLREGTRTENATDRVERGRQTKGEQFSHAKLTADKVRGIKQALRAGERQPKLARAYGVTQSTISAIKCGKLWTHIDDSVCERAIPVVSEVS